MHTDKVPVDVFHGSAGREAEHEMGIYAQIVRHDARHEQGSGGFGWLNYYFHSICRDTNSTAPGADNENDHLDAENWTLTTSLHFTSALARWALSGKLPRDGSEILRQLGIDARVQ
jgi:hypothetical protein